MADYVIVTGAAGFIGSHLTAALLDRGLNVAGIDNFDSYYSRDVKLKNLSQFPSDRFKVVEEDICNAKAMQRIFLEIKPVAVIHMAALAGVRPSLIAPQTYTTTNVDGLVNIWEAARESNCRQFIFASSSSVYGNNSSVPFTEKDSVGHPISPYGATKRIGELICESYSRLSKIPTAALRLFTVFGPRQRPDLAIAKFMRLIHNNLEVPMLGDGSASRDYTYVEDIVHGIISAYDYLNSAHFKSQTSNPFRIWNLGNSCPVTLRNMIECIEHAVGKKAMIKQLPPQLGDVDRTWADLTRSRSELGYQPKTKFMDGLKRQWEWMQRDQSAAHSGVTSQ